MQPKVSYYDVVLKCKDLVAISVIAKDYGWSATKLNQYLQQKGIQYKQGGKSGFCIRSMQRKQDTAIREVMTVPIPRCILTGPREGDCSSMIC